MTLKASWGLLAAPRRTIREEGFDQGPLWAWLLCQLPLMAVLVWTGLADPAQGYAPGARTGLLYLGGAGIICLFSMLLATAKSFLGLWAGGQRSTLPGAVRKLLPLHCLLSVLEAAATLALFLLRGALGQGAYAVLEQAHLFGQELLFGAGLAYILYQREQATLLRSIVAGLGCFLGASGWLLLSMFFG